MAQGNVCWLTVRVLDGKVDIKLLCAVEGVEMRALKDPAERPRLAASSSSIQPLKTREELMQAEVQAEAHGPQVRIRLDPGNPSEAQRNTTRRNASTVSVLL